MIGKQYIDSGLRGAERLGNLAAPETGLHSNIDPFLEKLRTLPTVRVEVEGQDGVKTTVESLVFGLENQRAYAAVFALAAYEPAVIARVGGRSIHGMLSANYDAHGEHRLGVVKIIPLNEPLQHGSGQLPDAGGIALLGGAVSLERPGVGSHDSIVGEELEHRVTSLGAVSLGSPEVSLGHVQHDLRKAGSSTASGLTSGKLGTLFAPTSTRDFQGFGEPLVVTEANRAGVSICLPKSYLDNPDMTFGALLTVDTTRVMVGNGIVSLVEQRGERALHEANQLNAQLGQR
jgi:hypothetical protein